MKKYITLAALLAAGTASANAVTTITWDDLRACNATFYNSTQSAVGESLTLSTAERVQFDVSSLNIDFSTEQYEFLFSVSDLRVGNAPFITWGTQGGQSVQAQQYGFGASGNANCWAATINGNGMSQKYSDTMSYTATGLDGRNLLSGTFKITIGTKNGSGMLDVTFLDSASNTTYTLTPENGLTMNNFASGGVISSVTFGGWTSTSTNGSSMTISSAVIPEPSAFGLLAGVGALALVASRRRRK